MDRIEILESAIKDALKDLCDHPVFDPEIFSTRDYDALFEDGGDCAFVTEIAMILADALDSE